MIARGREERLRVLETRRRGESSCAEVEGAIFTAMSRGFSCFFSLVMCMVELKNVLEDCP